MSEELDDHAASLLLQVLTKISGQFTTVFRFLVLCAFGAGVFFAMTHFRLDSIEQKLTDLPPKWLLNEFNEFKEETRREFRRQQVQIDRLEGHNDGRYD